MPPKKKITAEAQTQSAPNNRQKLSISSIDLDQLSLQELVELKTAVDAALAVDIYALKAEDVVLDYSLKLRTADGVAGENSGTVRLNALLSPRMLSAAPQRFEQAVLSQVLEPITTEALSLIENANPTDLKLSSARAQLADPYVSAPGFSSGFMPGLPG